MDVKRHLINFGVRHKYISLLLILCLVWAAAATGMTWLERTWGTEGTSYRNWAASLKAIAICLTSGFDIDPPTSTGGLIVAILTLVFGVITVGGLIACLTSDLVNQILFGLKIPVKPSSLTLRDHVVLFGWSRKTDRIVRELHAEVLKRKRPVIIVTADEERVTMPDHAAYSKVWTVFGNPTADETLNRADVRTAEAIIVLSDRREADPDAKSLLICLAVEAQCPSVYTCVELESESNRRHFERINTDEIVSVGDISANLLANCAISRGISSMMHELLTFQKEGNELYAVSPPPGMVESGMTFGEAAKRLLGHRIVLVGIQHAEQGSREHFAAGEQGVSLAQRRRLQINPPADEPIRNGQRLLVLAFSEPDLSRLAAT